MAAHPSTGAAGWMRDAPASWWVSLRSAYRVWQRNRDVFVRQWTAETGGFIVEPLIILAAMGLGLAGFVGDVSGTEYGAFVTPGVLAGYAMFHAGFEATFGAYLRMETHRVFSAVISTPVNVEDLTLGEAAWAATRSVLAAVAVLLIGALFGFVYSPLGVLTIPVAFVTGLVFAGFGLALVAVAPSIGTLNNFFTVFTTPLFFFSAVFFPLDQFPGVIEAVARFTPLTPAVRLSRMFTLGELDWSGLVDLALLFGYAAVILPLAVVLMRRRMIT